MRSSDNDCKLNVGSGHCTEKCEAIEVQAQVKRDSLLTSFLEY